ncbi:MAG: DEAD/DEAH box helicase [Lachnospiraceae bacterium]|nr:DEAD/DEAH box helicase [Lachnospiraceae bacterium]
MSDIVIKMIQDATFEVSGTNKLSGRSGMKFNIYLSAMKDVVIMNENGRIIITYNNHDEHVEAKNIKDIVGFLEACKAEVSFDEATQNLLDRQQEFESASVNRVESLRAIKLNKGSIQPNFEKFCAFCDKNLVITLRDYQYRSAFLLSIGEGGFDFSVPGAGKTIITYAAYAYLKQNAVVDNIFVIGPGSAYNAWYDEYQTCFGRTPEFENLASETTKDCCLYLGASKQHHKEITFINIEKIRMLRREISGFLTEKRTMLIIDEGHKIKNPNAAATEAALEIAKHAASRIILTGTPMPNGYEDLYSLTEALSPYKQILPYKYNQLKSMTNNGASDVEMTRIHESLDPHYSRISKKYLIAKGELLPYEIDFVRCEMNEGQQELYDRLNDFCGKLSDDIDEDFLMNLKKAILIRKMQISANPSLLKNSIISSMDELKEEYVEYADKDGSKINILAKADRELSQQFSESKIVKLINMFERGAIETNKNRTATELTYKLVMEGKKVLVWDIFVKNMDVLKSMIETRIGKPIELINGTVSGDDRQQAIKRFREDDSMVLLANPATLAESISLHRVCQNAIYVNRNFNAAQFIQSKDRIHRINMPEGTTAHYYFIENEDSIDAAISERLDIKETRMLKILDADDISIGGAEMEDTNIMSDQDVVQTYMR